MKRTIEVSCQHPDGLNTGYTYELTENEEGHARALHFLHTGPLAVQAILKHDDRQIAVYTQGDQHVEGQPLGDAESVADAVRIAAMQLARDASEDGDTMRHAESKRDELPRPDIRGPKGTDHQYRAFERERQRALDRRNTAAGAAHNLGIWEEFDGYLQAIEGQKGETA